MKQVKISRDAKLGVSVTESDLVYLDLICIKFNVNRSQAISLLIREKILQIVK